VERKKVTAAFHGGRTSSDGGVMLLGMRINEGGFEPDGSLISANV
jgi:hypothetical protein